MEIRNLGIKATIIIQPNNQNFTAYLEPYKTTYAGLVGMFEGQNEPELNAGLPEAYLVQQQWYQALGNDPYSDDVPLASPSTGSTAYYNTTTYPLSRATSDWLNIHIYTNGNPTELRAAPYFSTFTPLLPNKPIMVSEFGFHGAINRNWGFSPQFTNGDPNATHYIDGNGVGQPIVPRTDGMSSHAIYIVRSFLEYRRLGASRGIVYQFMNENPECGNPNAVNDTEKYGYQNQEQHFGLVGVWTDPTGKYRLNPLPAYYVVQRLIAWYNDIGTQSPPTQWPFALLGATSIVRSLPTARRDGSLDLALWLTVPSCNLSTYHPYNGELFPNGSCCWRDGDPQVEYAKYNLAVLGGELYPEPVDVTVQFGSKCENIFIHYPARNDTIYSAGPGNQLTIGVPVDPVFIRCSLTNSPPPIFQRKISVVN